MEAPLANLAPMTGRATTAGRSVSSRRARFALLMPASLRGAALMPAAALAVHQLRYSLAFGDSAPQELARQGHAYLSSLAPWLVLIATLGLGASLGNLARRWATGNGSADARRRHVGLRVWVGASLGLFAIYSGQELLEGALAGGHAAGLAAVFGCGGWWALPAAWAVGGVIALALRGSHALEDALAVGRTCLRVRLPAAATRVLRPTLTALRISPSPLADAAAGRAPPRRVPVALSA